MPLILILLEALISPWASQAYPWIYFPLLLATAVVYVTLNRRRRRTFGAVPEQ